MWRRSVLFFNYLKKFLWSFLKFWCLYRCNVTSLHEIHSKCNKHISLHIDLFSLSVKVSILPKEELKVLKKRCRIFVIKVLL